MTNLQAQVRGGTFNDAPAFKDAMEVVLKFLSRRFDVYKFFDHDDDSMAVVQTHVSAPNLPPVTFNPTSALGLAANDKRDIVASVHCAKDAPVEWREKSHDVHHFKNIASSVGIVVSFDVDLWKELQEMSDANPDNIARRLLVCYTALSYLNELAHFKVAKFLLKDSSLQSDSPDKFKTPLLDEPESGVMAEQRIVGCILEAVMYEERPYMVHATKQREIDGMSAVMSTGHKRKITVNFVKHIENVLSGDERFKEMDAAALEEAAKEALGLPSEDDVTPKEDAECLANFSNKWKSPVSKSKDSDAELWSYNDAKHYPWRRIPKKLAIVSRGLTVQVNIDDDSEEPFGFSIRALGDCEESLRRKNFPYRNCVIGNILRPSYTVMKGEHIYSLDDLYELPPGRYSEFLVIVVVGQEKRSLIVQRE